MVSDYEHATPYCLDVQVLIFPIIANHRLIFLYRIIFISRDILLRFASKDFTLENFHESIHLCNTTVQLKYRKTVKQNAQIPSELHWNLQKFKDYLRYAVYC